MPQGTVTALRRYPVKSMLGEPLDRASVSAGGLAGDRDLALLDLETSRVASAKHPRLWRALLRCRATRADDAVTITLPDGRVVGAADGDTDRVLSDLIGRRVRLADARPEAASLARPAPEDVLEHGDDADVPFEMLDIGQGTPGTTFVDHSPVHLITSSTLEAVATDAVRYRPNLVVTTPSGEPFAENRWVGREITIGSVRLRATLPTPRCAVPTLEHGDLPRAPHAVRTLMTENLVDVPGFGTLPCAGLYAEVVRAGTIEPGDSAVVH